jgi:hypothetical protein
MEPNESCPLHGVNTLSNPRVAAEISSMMLDFSKRLEESTELVHRNCSADEWKAYKKAAATIYVEMFVNVLEPLYKKHPALKPADWD